MARSGKKHAVKVVIGAAAIGVATSVTAVAVTQPASISATLVDLTALIVVGSSTNPSGAGVAEFFGGKFNNSIYTGDDPENPDIVYVDFREGPAGIQAALDANAGERNAVLASGWGAANASLLLRSNNPSLGNTLFILDNDVARPDGGFGTRYPLFALIGVNPFPTPSDLPDGVTAVNTGYQYDYNSNAPAYVLNPFSAVNALAAYLTTRLNQADIDLPVDVEGNPIGPDGNALECGGANTCALTENDAVLPCPDARCTAPAGDRITAYVTTRNDTTYVTYTTMELPLTTLVRSVFGDYIADVSAPLLKWAVDFGYYGGNPIPSDPSAYRPARFIPSIGDILTALVKLPGAIIQTLAAIMSPFQPRVAQTMSVARELAPSDEIVAVSDDATSTGHNLRLTNITGDGLETVPGDGDVDAGTTGAGLVGPQDSLGTGLPATPTQPDLPGTGTGTGTGTETSLGEGTGTGTGTGEGTGTGAGTGVNGGHTGEHNGDNSNEDENTNENENQNENENDNDSDFETGTDSGTAVGTGTATGVQIGTGSGTQTGTGNGTETQTGTGTGTGTGTTNNDNHTSNDTSPAG